MNKFVTDQEVSWMAEVGCRSPIRKKTYMPGSSEAEEGNKDVK